MIAYVMGMHITIMSIALYFRVYARSQINNRTHLSAHPRLQTLRLWQAVGVFRLLPGEVTAKARGEEEKVRIIMLLVL